MSFRLKDAERLTGLSYRQVQRDLAQGKLRATPDGRGHAIKAVDLVGYLRVHGEAHILGELMAAPGQRAAAQVLLDLAYSLATGDRWPGGSMGAKRWQLETELWLDRALHIALRVQQDGDTEQLDLERALHFEQLPPVVLYEMAHDVGLLTQRTGSPAWDRLTEALADEANAHG